MKIPRKILIAFAVFVCQVTSSERHFGDYSTMKRSVHDDQTKDLTNEKSSVVLLSNITDETATSFVKMVTELSENVGHDLEGLVRPLSNVISTIWINPLDESFKKNLYVFFDQTLDVAYLKYDSLENVWPGAIGTIESILIAISEDILILNEAAKIISKADFDNLSIINKTVASLTVSIVGLTEFIMSLIRLFHIHYSKNDFAIVSSVTPLQIIHQYTVSCITGLVSRTVNVLESEFEVTNYAAIKKLQTTLVSYISNLQQIAMNNYKTTMKQLIKGDVNSLFSKQLLISVAELTDEITINKLHGTTLSLYNIVRTHTESTFHILPDLLDHLIAVLFRCANVKYGKFEQLMTYAFDGLLDVVHYISNDLNEDIKSSASTGSFLEPSEPIDSALDNFKMSAKHFMRSIEHKKSTSDEVVAIRALLRNIIVTVTDLLEALLIPTNTILNDQGNKDNLEYRMTLASSLQCIMFYGTGLLLMILRAARAAPTKRIQDFVTIDEVYLNVSAIVRLALLKVQLIIDYTETENSEELLIRLFNVFNVFYLDLSTVIDQPAKVIGSTK